VTQSPDLSAPICSSGDAHDPSASLWHCCRALRGATMSNQPVM